MLDSSACPEVQYSGRQTRRNPNANDGVFSVPSTVLAKSKSSLVLRKLDSRCKNEELSESNACMVSNLNTGRSAKKCKVHHEFEVVDTDSEPNDSSCGLLDHLSTSDVPEEEEERLVPPPFRSIVENAGLATLITENMLCKKCRRVGHLVMTFPSIGVTTIPHARCSYCGWEKSAFVSKTQCTRVSKHKSVIDYDANMKFCISFMSNGDGGRDAQRFLSFLSLPSATTVGKSTFSKLERTTTDSIHQLTEGYMRSNLFEEVRLTYANDPSFNFEAWKDSVLNQEPYGYMLPFISVSMDMGWQKRSSGRRYDSSSGHAFLVGIKTRKPVSMCLKSSFCSVCCYHMKRHNLEQEEVPEHECVANHQGSAGSMESAALIEMIESLYYSNQVAVSKVITDDDSKMKAQCKWSNKDFLSHHNHPPGEKKWLIVGSKQVKQKQVTVYRKDGLLRYPVPQPTFLADPAH